MELVNIPETLKVQCRFDCLENLESSKTSDVLENFSMVDANSTSYEDFFNNFLISNKPCILKKSVTSDWNSLRDWVTADETVNFVFLRKVYGDKSVSVTQIKDEMSMDYGGMDCEDMKVKDYLDYWAKYIESHHAPSIPCLYLKDWHIVKDSMKIGYEPYVIPKFFQSDWLNEVWEDKEDDFRFAYMGPKGSWTPFHADVYGSFSWSSNIVGQKKWRLYPPGKEKRYIKSNGQIQYDYENPGVEKIDYVEVRQNSGEIIFVPSGWHHIVWNEADTISINHNWMNASNICHIWNQLKKALADVRVELDDIKSMDGFFEQCQLILKANHGMDYAMFIQIIEKIVSHRLNSEDCKTRGITSGHASYDLKVILHVVEEHLLKDSDMLENMSVILEKLVGTFHLKQ